MKNIENTFPRKTGNKENERGKKRNKPRIEQRSSHTLQFPSIFSRILKPSRGRTSTPQYSIRKEDSEKRNCFWKWEEKDQDFTLRNTEREQSSNEEKQQKPGPTHDIVAFDFLGNGFLISWAYTDRRGENVETALPGFPGKRFVFRSSEGAPINMVPFLSSLCYTCEIILRTEKKAETNSGGVWFHVKRKFYEENGHFTP